MNTLFCEAFMETVTNIDHLKGLSYTHRHKRLPRLLIGTACQPYYVASHCLAVVPQSGAKEQFIVLFTT